MTSVKFVLYALMVSVTNRYFTARTTNSGVQRCNYFYKYNLVFDSEPPTGIMLNNLAKFLPFSLLFNSVISV